MSSAAPLKMHEVEPLLIALQGVLGVVVPDVKRNQLIQSLSPLLSSYEMNSLTELAEMLQKEDSDDLRSKVLDVITRCDSDWQLSEEIRTILHKYILGQLPDDARVWVIGCGHGQLAYTVAMSIASHERISGASKNIKLIASDIPMTDISSAQSGVYSDIDINSLSEEHKRLYLTQQENGDWQIRDKIRQQVSFEQCDLTSDFQSIGHVDLIVCPDILVYYSNGVKAGVLKQFSALLNPGGILLTEHNQLHAPEASGFERVSHPAGVFYRQKA